MSASQHSAEEPRRGTTGPSYHESDLDRATANAIGRLRRRGIELSGGESSQQLVRLLTAVEEFERAVERSGGDMFINSPGTSQPERPEWVLPTRAGDESMEAYVRRIERATEVVEGE
jgi:hypothetical protein